MISGKKRALPATSIHNPEFEPSTPRMLTVHMTSKNNKKHRQKFSEGVRSIRQGVLGAAQDSQKPLGIWCKILQSSNFQTLHSNFRKALFFITNFFKIFIKFYTN